MTYFDELCKAMTWLGEKPDIVFLGQSVLYPGNAIYKTLQGVPKEKIIELPVMEDAQLGMAIGMSLMGKVPICIFPRMDFLMCAMNQLVNHLDKIRRISEGQFCPRVIIRTCVGATKPLYPGLQHCGDYTGITSLLSEVIVCNIKQPSDIMFFYKWAYEMQGSSLLIERGDSYGLSL